MPERVDVSGTEYLVTGTHISNGNLPLDIALFKPMREVMAPFRQLAWNLGLIIGATLAAAIIAGLYLGRTAARPVLRLAAGAARIAAGDYSTRVEASGGRELANLADAFNSMQVGIADRESQLLHMARYDVQTGLPNRIQAEEWLAQHLRQVGRDQRVLILLLAVVNLKEISASLGFGIAEQLVRHLASQLGQWQKDGLVARLDAASFVVLMPVRDAVDIETMARRVRDQAQQPLHTAGISLQANVVMGVAEAPQHSASAAEALRCAEAAVEAALQSQESIALFERSSDDIRRRHLRLGAELPQALKSGQLFLHYQPKARASDAVVQGVEALVRWRHPEIGMVSPCLLYTSPSPRD
jgi:diguanylate cyclase (GGDEF)-like protein